MDRQDSFYIASSFVCVLVALLAIRLSSFSAGVMVNLQNYVIKAAILQTEGMSTIDAIFYFLSPFFPVLLALILFVLALSILAIYEGENLRLGIFTGALALASSLIVFRTIWSLFFGLGLLAACFYVPRIAPAYRKEFKKWPVFRSGSRSVSRGLFIANVLISFGIFLSVLSAQSAYEASFKSELTDAMKSVARGIPGASVISESQLGSIVDQAITSSELFRAYIRWLPVSAALGTWFILELLRNVLLSNIAGLFTSALSKISFNP